MRRLAVLVLAAALLGGCTADQAHAWLIFQCRQDVSIPWCYSDG